MKRTVKELLEADSEQQMEEYLELRWYEGAEEGPQGADSRKGHYERDDVTPRGVIRFRVRRRRGRSFLPRTIQRWERRAPEVAKLIRQTFLRGISRRGVRRAFALVTKEAVSAQTVSRLTRVLDWQVEASHQARLDDSWAYLILDGVWMKVRRASAGWVPF
ncbi:MAG: transposase [Acidobacteria bacterium]|nr:transposase [Acidobacteriota bacterium]